MNDVNIITVLCSLLLAAVSAGSSQPEWDSVSMVTHHHMSLAQEIVEAHQQV